MYRIKVDEHGSILIQYRSPEADPAHGAVIDGFRWLERNSPLEVGTSFYDGSDWIVREAAPTKWHVWISESWVESDVVKGNVQLHAMEVVRAERNGKLSACDWTQLVDAPVTDAKRAEWVTYRAALREIPTTIVTDVADIVWPTAPN